MPNTIRLARRDVWLGDVEQVLQARPNLALDIARLALHSSVLDLNLNYLFTGLLSGKQPAAFAVFHEMRDLGLRESAFNNAAKGILSDSLRTNIAALFTRSRSIGTQRGRVIHAIWAISDKRKDALLACKPKSLNERVNEAFPAFHEAVSGNRISQEARLQLFQKLSAEEDEYDVYKHADFEFIIKQIREAVAEADRLGVLIMREVAAPLVEPPRRRGGKPPNQA